MWSEFPKREVLLGVERLSPGLIVHRGAEGARINLWNIPCIHKGHSSRLGLGFSSSSVQPKVQN